MIKASQYLDAPDSESGSYKPPSQFAYCQSYSHDKRTQYFRINEMEKFVIRPNQYYSEILRFCSPHCKNYFIDHNSRNLYAYIPEQKWEKWSRTDKQLKEKKIKVRRPEKTGPILTINPDRLKEFDDYFNY